jgi:hypothetical protein
MVADIEKQLKEAMTAAVAECEPPRAIMELVRRRYRRRNRNIAAAGVLILAVAITVTAVTGAVGEPAAPVREHPAAGPLFPGGGRILFATAAGSLVWLYPNGRTAHIAFGFAGATPAGPMLLAWKQTANGFSYYTMNTDGSDVRLVMPSGRSKRVGTIDAELSPDGTRLGFVVQDIISVRDVTEEIWSVDLATGRKTDLGPGPGFVWRDNSSILADSRDQRSLQLVNVATGMRSPYLTVTDPSLVRAYETVRPRAGLPESIWADGWSTGTVPAVLAVSLGNTAGTGGPPAEILLRGGHVLPFAPDTDSLLQLTWGMDGIFMLHTGYGDNPIGWNSYVGTVSGGRLARPQTFGEPWDTMAFSPHGDVIAFGYGIGTTAFVPVPAPACQRAGRCLHFKPRPLFGRGTLLAWEPAPRP